MTRQEIINFCLTFPSAHKDYPFDGIVDEDAITVMQHKSFALIMRHKVQLYLNFKCESIEDVPESEIMRMIERSYNLVKSKERKRNYG